MILEYYRPTTIDEAVGLLKQETPRTIPLGGGACLAGLQNDVAVVDLQALGLDYITKQPDFYLIGATTTLEKILEYHKNVTPIAEAIKIQNSKNQRETGTVAGLIVSENGRSALLTLLLGLDIKIHWLPGNIWVTLEDWLSVRKTWKQAALISEIKVDNEINVAFESVGRSTYDLPMICCSVTKWKTGRMRVVFGGFGKFPSVAFDGDEKNGVDEKIEFALSNSSDQWASSEYRLSAGTKLAKRLIAELK